MDKHDQQEKAKEIRFNINQHVLIKFNPLGLKVWGAYLEGLGLSHRYPAHISAHILPESHPLRNEYMKFQLWDLMAVFGDSIRLGSDLPFAAEIILLPES
jgi:hypothetical protein